MSMNKKIVNIRDKNHLTNFNNSSVENIFILDWFLKAFSSDHIGQLFNDNEIAKYSISFLCGAKDKDSFIYSSKFLSGNIINLLRSDDISMSNSEGDISEYLTILSLLFSNSENVIYGTFIPALFLSNFSNKSLLVESFLKNENKIFASTTNFEKNITYK